MSEEQKEIIVVHRISVGVAFVFMWAVVMILTLASAWVTDIVKAISRGNP